MTVYLRTNEFSFRRIVRPSHRCLQRRVLASPLDRSAARNRGDAVVALVPGHVRCSAPCVHRQVRELLERVTFRVEAMAREGRRRADQGKPSRPTTCGRAYGQRPRTRWDWKVTMTTLIEELARCAGPGWMTKSPARGRALGPRALAQSVSFVVASGQDQDTEAKHRKRAGLGNGRGSHPGRVGSTSQGNRRPSLHTNGEPVPELVAAAAPGHRVERARKANRAVRPRYHPVG